MSGWVEVQEGFLTRTECAIAKALYRRTESHGDPYNKRYKVVFITDLLTLGLTKEFNWMARIAKKVARAVVVTYDLPPLYIESAFLVRLPKGTRHPLHRDNCREDGSPNHTPHRDYSALVYLNSSFLGGTIVFPGQARIRPKTGMLVAFPSGHDFPHKVETVKQGVRYSMPVWMTFNPKEAIKELYPLGKGKKTLLLRKRAGR